MKAPNGAGSIIKLRNNKFQARVTVDGKRKSQTFEKQRDAMRWKDEMNSAARKGECVDPSSMPFGGWWDTWVSVYKSSSVKPASLDTYRYARARLSKTLLHKQIKSITRADIQGELNRIGADRSRRTVEMTRTAINMCLSHAVEDGLIIKNPATGTKLPPRVKQSPKSAPDAAIALIFAGSAAPPKITVDKKPNQTDISEHAYYDALSFILLSALRNGECVALEWSDWDPVNPGVIHVPGTKTIKSDGYVAIPVEAQEILERRRNLKTVGRFIFCDFRGGRILVNSLYHFCKRKTGTSVHSLRHAYATKAIEAGVDPRTVQEQLRHADIRTTLQMYVDVSMEGKAKAANAVSNAMKKAAASGDNANALPTQIVNICN